MTFRKVFKACTFVFTILAIICFFMYQNMQSVFWFSLTLTLVTIAYHFIMRLTVGIVIDYVTRKGINYNIFWFRERRIEKKIFGMLNVKRWKYIVPTYEPERFSTEHYDIEGIIQNMCAAEIIHELIIVLGYASVLFSLFTPDWPKYMWIFIVTAFFAGLMDSIFVIVQRYNRPRLMRLYEKRKDIEVG